MDIETPIARVVRILESQKATADAAGVSQPTVWEWLKKGRVPAEYVIPLEKATGAKGDQVSRHDMRPDIYPLEDEAAA